MVEKLYSLPVGFFFRGKELCFGHDLAGSTPEGQSRAPMNYDSVYPIFCLAAQAGRGRLGRELHRSHVEAMPRL